jgi:putative glycosyltransferase (TIGR04348 family)
VRIGIITPAPPRSRYGNRVTALRWARILRSLGHRVRIQQTYEGERFGILIALHARRSFPAIERFYRQNPGSPLIVALTGTDLYRDIRKNRKARKSLDLATRIVVLQPKALDELQRGWREKSRVIYQSVTPKRSLRPARSRGIPSRGRKSFDVCVIGHLRSVKDPFRAALAARLLPRQSRIRIVHAGGAMSSPMARRARREMKRNPHYRWIGEQPPRRIAGLLARSKLCVLSSRMEGGANVLSEAIVAACPVLASRIPGSVGILGADYPGYFKTGDTRELARLMLRAETDSAFHSRLWAHGRKLASLFRRQRERKAWSSLIAGLS